MILSGPKEKMDGAWERLGKDITLEVPKGTEEGVHTFLGCKHTRFTKTINGKKVECMEYDVSSAMKRCVAKYEEAVYELTGKYPKLYPVKTPFIEGYENVSTSCP